MNTATIPESIVCETRVQYLGGDDIHFEDPRHGDTCNLSTGEVRVARMIGGVVYDTANAAIVVGIGEYFGLCRYLLRRLYRTHDGKFFQLQMQWSGDVGVFDLQAISAVRDVLSTAKKNLLECQTAEFLRGWYCSGLLPLDDEFVRNWAESVLPVVECEAVLAALAGRYSPRPRTGATDAEGSAHTA